MAIVLRLTIDKAQPIYRGQDHFWRCIRGVAAAGASFTASNIRSMAEEHHKGTVPTYLRRLKLAGYIREAGKVVNAATGRQETSFRLVRDQERPPALTTDGRAAPRQVSLQQAMWNVVRGPMARKGFTFEDVISWGSTEGQPIKRSTAKRFVQALRQGGYLIQLDPGHPGRAAQWRLRPSRNTGPLPPLILTSKIVWDQNQGKIAGEAIAEEAAP